MFYEINEIESKLQCAICKNRIDIPRLLPCGFTICDACSKKNNNENLMLFKCVLCNNNLHPLPQSGFPIQKLVLELLKIKSTKVYRCGIYENVDSSLKCFEKNLKKFETLIKNPEEYLRNYSKEIKDEIEKQTEKHVNELIKSKEKLLNDVTEFESMCLSNTNHVQYEHLKDDALNSIQNFKKQFQEWNSYFQRADTNEQTIEKIYHDIQSNNQQLLSKFINFEKILFNNQKFNFIETTKELTRDDIGEIKCNLFQ